MFERIIKHRYLNFLILFSVFFVFFLLLFKNPFSERNLIPNLEPFPDTIHYLNPPLSFTEGKGFLIEREGRVMKPSVPFLYSFTLIPGFLVMHDVRIFYLTNILLAFTGFFFLYKFLEKIISINYVVYLILFLYITNYFVYWFPNLPMAENLLLPLYNIGLFLLVIKITVKNAVFAAAIGISFYATKYASLVLTLTFLFLYTLKILLSLNLNLKDKIFFKIEKRKLSVLISFVLGVFLFASIFFLAEFLGKANNILFQVYELIAPIFAEPAVSNEEVVAAAPVQTWFSLTYFNQNIQIYLNAIMGNPMRFLWDFTPIVPKYIAIPGLVGIIAGIFTRGYRFISFSLLLLILTPIVVMSTFYSTDARYIYNAIPSLLAGFGLVLNFIYINFKEKKLEKIFYVFLILFFAFYSYSNFTRLKSQISLNLKYTETPWYYISAKTFDEYFKNSQTSDKDILITALPPYYLDFYNKSGYKVLPLSKEQEFARVQQIVWGENDYSDFIKLYQKYLDEGYNLYVTNAALGNVGFLYRDYNLIKDNFTLTKVLDGCLNTCDIYKLSAENK